MSAGEWTSTSVPGASLVEVDAASRARRILTIGGAWFLATMVAALLVNLQRPTDPVARITGDFIQFWVAGNIVADGGSPYDVDAQANLSAELGWDREIHGRGRYDFMPFYYPPWLALPCVLLVPLGFDLARSLWFVLSLEAVLLAGWLLRRFAGVLLPKDVAEFAKNSDACSRPAEFLANSATTMRESRGGLLPFLLVPAFALTVQALWMGQVAPFMLLLIVGVWRLTETGSHLPALRSPPSALRPPGDRSAGWCLAALSIKPQLTVILIGVVLLWAIRNRRWRVVEGFVTAVAVFVTASSIFLPGWLPAMLSAPSETPLVIAAQPWKSVTWWSVLRSVGLEGPPAWGLYLLVNLPLAGWLLYRTLRSDARTQHTPHSELRTPHLEELISLSLLASFLAAPYARCYDMVVLLIPAVWLLRRLPENGRAWFLIALTALPWLHQMVRLRPDEFPAFSAEVWWFWLIAVLAGCWTWASQRTGSGGTTLAKGERGGVSPPVERGARSQIVQNTGDACSIEPATFPVPAI